jgi:hypothetical protein
MSSDAHRLWHEVLAERNKLSERLEALADGLRRYHDDRHVGAAQWCEYPPCRLLFRPTSWH